MKNFQGRIRKRSDATAGQVPYQIVREKTGDACELAPGETLKWGGGAHSGVIVFRDGAGWCLRTEHKGRTLHLEIGSLLGRAATRIGDVRLAKAGA